AARQPAAGAAAHFVERRRFPPVLAVRRALERAREHGRGSRSLQMARRVGLWPAGAARPSGYPQSSAGNRVAREPRKRSLVRVALGVVAARRYAGRAGRALERERPVWT